MNYNGRPLSRKQTVRLLVALTILVWATQTLLNQWGFGAEVPASDESPQIAAAEEKFVPGTPRFMTGATLELRNEATVVGAEVKLRQICRWSDADSSIFEPIGDLVLVRVGPAAPFKAVSIDQIKATLHDAGVNIAAINFAGAMSCTVSRSDVEYDERTALQQWLDAKEQATGAGSDDTRVAAAPSAGGALDVAPATVPSAGSPVRTLRDALVADLATRLNLPVETLQVDFKPQDQKLLNICEPLFRLQIEPLRVKNLGPVAWNVSISAENGTRKATVTAEARAWQTQVVAAKPLAYRQIIRDQDVIERRTLVSQLGDDPLLSRDQVVGQQAGRELKPGVVLTSRMIEAVQLVKTGQYVTVTLEQGTVRIRTVARALEPGSYGQTIRVKNEATKEVFQVMVTGPQTATMNLSAPVAVMDTRY